MAFDVTPLLVSWKFIAKAFWITVMISGLAILLGLSIGVVVGTLRTYGGRLMNGVLSLYVDTARAVPILVILVWMYFAFPLLIGRSLHPITVGVLALGVHIGAYMAEAIRAGLTSVRPGQMRAGLALGMGKLQAIRIIVLPQAMIRMLPPLGSLLVITIKDSAIASVIAVPELLRQANVLAGDTYRPFEIYTAAMILYFLLCYPVARGVDRIYRRLVPLGAS